MGIEGLRWQVVNWPFGFGLNQQTDKRMRPAPALDIANDVQVDEQGGLQTRLPFAAMSSSIAGGGTLSSCRRMFVNGDELCVLTDDSLYSYDAQLAKWVLKGTHLAIKLAEEPVFISTGDQIETDRAELLGRIYYAWTDTSKVYVAVVDKATGATWLGPTAVGGTGTRPRLVALTAKVLLFWHAGTDAAPGNIQVYSIDPAGSNPSDLATDLGTPVANGTPLAAAASGSYYDVVKVNGANQAIFVARRLVTTSYEIAKVSAAGVVTASTKARTCDGPIAVSTDPTGTSAQVIRANGTNIQGDRITISTLVDAATGQAVGTVAGTPVNQIAVCHRSVQDSGAFRAYAFWSAQESDGTGGVVGFDSKFNFVDTAGTIGTQAVFVKRTGLVSRAFDFDGRVYVWGAFAFNSTTSGMTPPLGVRAQLQNTFFMYRDDAFLCAKAAPANAGGYRSAIGHLAGVALVDGTTTFAFCGTERRIIPLGGAGHTGYADRGPRDFKFTFDSDEARRTAKIGRTVYLTGAEVLQYDRSALYEVGFHLMPWLFAGIAGGVGNVVNGTYSYKSTLRWENAVGELERSTTAVGETVIVSTGPDKVAFSLASHHHTHKSAARSAIAIEMWRSAVNPPLDAPFYLITSKDPGVLSGDNRYIANDPTATAPTVGDDNFADATLLDKEQNPENDGVLENLSPPAASIIAATDTRVFLAGVAGDPHRVWYSKQRNDGEIVAFHDGNVVEVPHEGGDITAIAVREGALIVWRETATYLLPGFGFTNTGDGQNFGPAQDISKTVGAVNQESVAWTDEGYIFKSRKGWYLLPLGGIPRYIGGAVADHDDEDVLAVTVIDAQHQVRVLTEHRMLVLDTQSGQWFSWSIADGLDAVMWQGVHVYLTATGPKAQATTYTGLTYGQDVETAWIKPADLQGAVAVRKVQPVGEFRSTHYLRVRIAYNYRYTAGPVPDYVDDKSWLVSPSSVAGDLLQLKHGPKRPRCQSLKVRLTAVAASTIATATGLSAPVTLLVGNWTAILTGVVPRSITLGFLFADLGADNIIEVRDNETWSPVTGWASSPGNCGVRVEGGDGADISILELEAALAGSQLLTVSTPHVGAAVIDVDALDTDVLTGTFPEAFPTGEALKLTGLGLEVGNEGGLYRALPKAQQQ